MKPFIKEVGVAAVLAGRNIDTDQIVPGRFLKQDRKDGYGQMLFHDLRFDQAGQPIADFVLNQAPYQGAKILLAQSNFGCGSSREAAAYALDDFGIRAVLAPSFGDIFLNNALKNGLLPVCLPENVCELLSRAVEQHPGMHLSVDLAQQCVTLPSGESFSFAIDPFRRECLMKGVDELDLARALANEINAFEKAYFDAMPWVNPAAIEASVAAPAGMTESLAVPRSTPHIPIHVTR